MTYFLSVLLISFAVGYFEQRKQARQWEQNWRYCKRLNDLLEMQLTEEQKKKYRETADKDASIAEWEVTFMPNWNDKSEKVDK